MPITGTSFSGRGPSPSQISATLPVPLSRNPEHPVTHLRSAKYKQSHTQTHGDITACPRYVNTTHAQPPLRPRAHPRPSAGPRSRLLPRSLPRSRPVRACAPTAPRPALRSRPSPLDHLSSLILHDHRSLHSPLGSRRCSARPPARVFSIFTSDEQPFPFLSGHAVLSDSSHVHRLWNLPLVSPLSPLHFPIYVPIPPMLYPI